MCRPLLALAAVVLVTLPASAQTRTPSFLDDDTYFASVFAGAGVSADGTLHPASTHFGGAAGAETLSTHVGHLGTGQFVELGAIGPLADRSTPTPFLSYDLSTNILLSRATHTVPFAAAGYTYVFGEGSAINFGLGADFHYRRYRAIRVELRDYYLFTQVPQHNIALRLGWQFSIHNP